ncbi:hypothetical protein PV10_06254 [Exophiala mesophila]|uniref:Tr-type G domain-containing protein n=1 Tax=Exophiala mesophila TaxID=212818 RepID=A0A0D1ZAM9_EXOME|nr:uncharacterized protein PV10_06254 [Exophiala mesophila]KIV91747.1 hypothetical protein PV10_06254 [Exophiala mesophila]
MASIFTYQEEPPRIHSPWSTPGTSTPQTISNRKVALDGGDVRSMPTISKLEPERHDGPTEYKLHLLLRPRRKFLSLSTTSLHPGQHQSLSLQSSFGTFSTSEPLSDRLLSLPVNQARQHRLHQLTTQLLWRLQQSSPFHSSSTADLVLPLLPEATPKLGIPERPAKLLPGLEESQGALYEIGVADDGMLVGLAEDELQESLGNLRAMASSLGCVTKILRRVVVGTCEWLASAEDFQQEKPLQDNLWVAEVLVYPDSRDYADPVGTANFVDHGNAQSALQETASNRKNESIHQIRVTLVGSPNSGKSSLLGALSTSVLDNGRGKSRLSLLKHRHEIASGITSSVAQELIGYSSKERSDPDHVINYATGNVSSWLDIHALSERLVFFSDSPGSPRFAKSTFRALISWRPSWTVLCIAADADEQRRGSLSRATNTKDDAEHGPPIDNMDIMLAHLDVCLRLQLPLVIAFTKMDLASKIGLRSLLTKALSTLKAAGRRPLMLGDTVKPALNVDTDKPLRLLNQISKTDQNDIDSLMGSKPDFDAKAVPIIFTSAVSASGIGKLHALLRSLRPVHVATEIIPRSLSLDPPPNLSTLFHIDEVFSIPPSRVYSAEPTDQSKNHGVVLCGHVAKGTIRVGSIMSLGPFPPSPPSSYPELSAFQSDDAMKRSHSYSTGHTPTDRLPDLLAASFSRMHMSKKSPDSEPEGDSKCFAQVQVVSVRNLRLPVIQIHTGETGTIGVELLLPPPVKQHDSITTSELVVSLRRARKGMVLTDRQDKNNKQQPLLQGYRSFVASFPASDFSRPDSPPLILGGHAIVYINSIRAATKVIAVALDESPEENHGHHHHRQRRRRQRRVSSGSSEVFVFDSDEGLGDNDNDDDDEDDEDGNDQQQQQQQQQHEENQSRSEARDIRITFRFTSNVEWMRLGDQVLVVPALTAPGPVAGNAVANISALAGLVGNIIELS